MYFNFDHAEGPFVILVIVAMLATAIVHIAFALAVLADANSLGARTALVGPGIWGLATLLGGVFVAAIYWALNRSVPTSLYAVQALRTLQPDPADESASS